jgi:multidrug efflux pump subunit AcrB
VQHGRAYLLIERCFDRLLDGYRRGLDFVLAHQRATLFVFLCTVALTVVLYIVIPKGFFPQQDTGIIAGLSDAPQDISFSQMVRRQHQLTDIIARDPDVQSYAAFIGGSRPVNTGFPAALDSSRAMSAVPAPTRSSFVCVITSRRFRGNGVPAGGAGPERRRPHYPHAIPIHAAGCGHQ